MDQLAMLDHAPTSLSMLGKKDLRRHIDRAVSRALVDGEYASVLLADPAVALQDRDCPPQQYLSLLSIRATDLVDFARQARALFWSVEPLAFHARSNLRYLTPQEPRPLAAFADG